MLATECFYHRGFLLWIIPFQCLKGLAEQSGFFICRQYACSVLPSCLAICWFVLPSLVSRTILDLSPRRTGVFLLLTLRSSFDRSTLESSVFTALRIYLLCDRLSKPIIISQKHGKVNIIMINLIDTVH